MKLQLLNSCGQIREIKNNIITSDDGKELDITKHYHFKVIIPNPQIVGMQIAYREMTLLQAQDILIRRLIAEYGIAPRYQDANLDCCKTDSHFEKIMDYVKNPMPDKIRKSMLLYGSEGHGCGKTYILNAIANYWFNNPKVGITFDEFGDVTVFYMGMSYKLIREEDLMLRVYDSYERDHRESESQIYRDLANYDILAIDDLGKNRTYRLETNQRVLFQIIDTRYNNCQGVVISTNLSREDILKWLGVASTDRLNEMTKNYQLKYAGKSRRG